MHLSLDLRNAQTDISQEELKGLQSRFSTLDLPAFHQYTPDIGALEKMLKPFQDYQNIIVIANGGSRTSALAYFQALGHLRNTKTIEFLSTMEPDVLAGLRKQYSPDDTLVIPISKSGTNVDVLEPLLTLLDYPIVAITSPEKGVLYEIAQQYSWPIVPHPEVGGRYSGRTECGLAPAALMGLNIQLMNEAAVSAYDYFAYDAPVESNIALQAALACLKNDEAGYSEIFMPVYSQPLAGFLPLVVQLIHESTGKGGKGQTIFGDQAPESQHHTNQRFFGGRKNVMGWFMTVAQQRSDEAIAVPKEVQQLQLRDGTLSDLNGIPLATALAFDYEGVAENATRLGIPHITLTVDSVTEESVGELLSFFHYYTVYSALLRDQDPFDQPEVEDAKTVSFEKRKEFTR